MMRSRIYYEDLLSIFAQLTPEDKQKLQDTTILITGCAGFLGYYMMSFLTEYSSQLGVSSIIGIDNFKLGQPKWLDRLQKNHPQVTVYSCDITQFPHPIDTDVLCKVNLVIHMASIASPTYYRRFPLETIDANVTGLRLLLDFYTGIKINGFLFFSSSEIYGDPEPGQIPTSEDYWGNVSSIGPRACYDESKRMGETLCYVYAEKYQMPITIVRPFNVYGPGMRLEDKRVPADFAKAIVHNQQIVIHSDGRPTRTFCYVSDAIVGYLKALLFGKFEYFNIGIDGPEISIRQLASIYIAEGASTFGYDQSITFSASEEKQYLIHNPSRRCPDISKARNHLNYSPSISVYEGVHRFLTFLKEGGDIQ